MPQKFAVPDCLADGMMQIPRSGHVMMRYTTAPGSKGSTSIHTHMGTHLLESLALTLSVDLEHRRHRELRELFVPAPYNTIM